MEISSKQAKTMIFISSCAMKLLMLPSLVTSGSQNAVCFVFIIMFGIDALFLYLLTSISSVNPNLSVKDFFEKSFGKIISKILFVLLGILFAFKIVALIQDTYTFYNETMYVDFNWFLYLFPLFLLIGYVSLKRLRNLARMSQIFIYFIVVTIFSVFLFSFGNYEYLCFLPLFPQGISPVLRSCLDYSFWFGDFMLFYFFMGKIQVTPQFKKDIFKGLLYAAIIVTILASIHYSLYGAISTMNKLAIVDITQFLTRISTTGRFHWVITFMWPVATIYTMALYGFCSVKSFQICFNVSEENKKNLSIITIGFILALFAGVLLTQSILVLFIVRILKYLTLTVQYIVPLFLPIGLVKYLKKERAKNV